MVREFIRKYQSKRIKSVGELKEIIVQIQELRIFFDHMEFYRGHSLNKYKLYPGIARYDIGLKRMTRIEKCLYRDFSLFIKSKRGLIREPFKDSYQNHKLKNKWYSLFQAQHLGLKTRLLDWTIDWIVALNFAVENESYHGEDGTFNVFMVPREYLYNDRELKGVTERIDPFHVENDMMINTPSFLFDNQLDFIGERRFRRQSGRFWMQSSEKVNTPLNEQHPFSSMLLKLIIDGESKQDIKRELENSGAGLDWHYYRNEYLIDDSIKLINEIHLENNICHKLLNYTKLAYHYIS